MRKIKKFLAMGMAIAVFSGGLGMTTLPRVEAAGLFDIILAGASSYQEGQQIKKELQTYDSTEEGRQKLLTSFKQRYGVAENSPWQPMAERAMTNLMRGIAQSDPSVWQKPFLWFINQDNTFNAFCSVGHVMSINQGLFNLIQNEDELAVVLGHEMGHGMKGHALQSLQGRLNTSILANMAGAALGQDAIGDAVLQGIVNNSTASTSKEQEWEADGLSFDYVLAGGYNPGATAAVWERVIEKSGDNPQSFVGEIFSPSDHPTNQQRRDKYAQTLKDYSLGHAEAKDGVVYVNGKAWVTPNDANGMSGKERSYFVLGNLAAAYHHREDKKNATVQGTTIYLGAQPIMTATNATQAQNLAQSLNQIK